jgi:hypothetical protein
VSDLPAVRDVLAERPHITPVVVIEDAQGVDRLLYGLQPKQWEAFCLTPLMRQRGVPGPVHIGYGGAAFGGKSWWARAVLTAVAFRWPGSTAIIFRETETEVKRNHLDRWMLEVPQVFEGRRLWSWNGADKCITWFNNSKTYLGYLQYEKDVSRYQGPSFDCMVFEEATLLPWSAITWLTSTRLRSSIEGTVPFACYPSNPGGKGHGSYKRLFVQRRYREEERAADYAFVQSLLADNIEGQRRDPSYKRKLDLLPEPHRSWQRDGNFAAGAGSALSMLDWRRHLWKPPRPDWQVPGYWVQFGAFDWGYHHPFSFGRYAVNEDGVIFKLETVWGVRLLPHEQAQRIRSTVPIERLAYIVAGHDVKAQRKALGEDTPTVKEQFAEAGILLSDANIDRKMGLQELRKRLDWTNTGPIIHGEVTEGEPRLLFRDTPGNRRCLEQIENMVSDPSDPEDVLKMDANEFGEGGDDHYDETRYAVASRPLTPAGPWKDQPIDINAPEVLAHEAHTKRLVKRSKVPGPRVIPEVF